MPRRVQDIVPGDRRGIRGVQVEKEKKVPSSEPRPARKQSAKEKAFDEKEPAREISIHKPASKLEALDKAASEKESGGKKHPQHMSLVPPAPRKKRGSRKPWIYGGAGVIVLIVAVAFIASTYFSHATFTIVPRVVPVNVNSTYIAQGTPTAGSLSYELIPVQGTLSATVPAVDGPQTSVKAQGKVTLYNSYSAQSQRLIAGTRLSSNSGLIYRLAGSVVIPGYTQKAGSTVPGTVSATIQADQAGADYNIASAGAVTDLQIVAYKGTPKYAGLYAQLAGDVSGGFVGHRKTVNPTVLASTTATLRAQLISSLQGKAAAAVPVGYIMYGNAFASTLSAPVVSDSGANTATITAAGTLYGIVFKETDLITRLASLQAVTSFAPYGFEAPGLESLSFSIANPNDFHPEKKTALIMKLKGDFKMIGTIPVDELKKKLAGVPLAGTQAILKPYYGSVIESGSGELIPAWAKVPSDISRITINVEKP